MATTKKTTSAQQETTTPTQRMNAIFERVGARYGYEEVNAEFTPFKDFKLRWSRNFKWINFEVSDYLVDAPENVLENLADTVFAKIKGEDRSYPEMVVDYLTSDDFIASQRQVYYSRAGLRNEDWLTASLDRLTAKGLVRVRNVQLGVSSKLRDHVFCATSVIFKVVAVNSKLAEDVSEEELDCAVYRALCHLETCSFGSVHEENEAKEEEAFSKMENYKELERALFKKGYFKMV